jgi:thiamine biosynthesis protein ThiC
MIEDLYINNGNVSVSHSLLMGKKLSASIPDINLQDIGKEEQGASPAIVAKEIMASVTSNVGTAVGTLNLDKVLGNVSGTIEEGADTVLDTGKEAAGKLKGLFQ